MYSKVSEIHIGRRFLRDGCHSQQIIPDVASESLIPYSLTQKEHQNYNTVNTGTPNSTSNQTRQL